MRRPLRPARVRAAAVFLALLAQALLLLLFSFGGRAPVTESRSLVFISIWPPDQPAPEVIAPAPAPAPSPPRRAAERPSRVTAPTAEAPELATPPDSTSPASAAQPGSQTQADNSRPSIDWYGEASKSITRSAARAGEPSTFSPPPKVMHQACKPRKQSFEWNPEEKKAGLLPLPYVRLGNCVVGLGFFGCTGGTEANGHLFDDFKKGDRPVSSVPDPNICD